MGNYKVFGRPVHSPIARLLVIITLLVWLPLTLPAHAVVWLFNGRGFIVKRGQEFGYEPPVWATWGSLAAAVALAIILL